jgi:hypothetical protein
MVLLELCSKRRKKLCATERVRGENDRIMDRSFSKEAMHPLFSVCVGGGG